MMLLLLSHRIFRIALDNMMQQMDLYNPLKLNKVDLCILVAHLYSLEIRTRYQSTMDSNRICMWLGSVWLRWGSLGLSGILWWLLILLWLLLWLQTHIVHLWSLFGKHMNILMREVDRCLGSCQNRICITLIGRKAWGSSFGLALVFCTSLWWKTIASASIDIEASAVLATKYFGASWIVFE